MWKRSSPSAAARLAAFLVVSISASISPAQLVTIVEFRGMLGTDETGREAVCEKLKELLETSKDDRSFSSLIKAAGNERFHLDCEGYHNRVVVLRVKEWSSSFRALRAESLISEMLGKPYRAVTNSLDAFVPHRGAGRPMPVIELTAKLNALWAKSVGDFLYACGFEMLVVKDEESGASYVEHRLAGIGTDG